MGQWEDVTQDDAAWAEVTAPPAAEEPIDDDNDNPFGGVEQPDGLVYSDERVSPELQWQQQPVAVPLPPVRPRPERPMPQRSDPWKPGPDPTPARVAGSGKRGTIKALLMTTIPLAMIAGLGLVVYRTMAAYGY